MYELLALLLPVAAASGWYAAKRAYSAEKTELHARKLNSSYSRGLDFMLQDRMDEALDLLSTTIQVDSDGLDLKLSLGTLFRKRGEVDKALAVHESVLNSSLISDELRSRTLMELGLDYYAAGLLDRAESVFSSLTTQVAFGARARESLLKIYQREKDWSRAIACLSEMGERPKLPNKESVSQFYCELAELERSTAQHVKALQSIEQALKDDPDCIRGYILRAQIEASVKNWRGVASSVDEIERRAPEFLPEVLDLAIDSRIRREESEAAIQSYLRHLFETYGTEEAGVRLSDRLAVTDGIEVARRFLTSALRRRPSALLARKLFALLAEERQGCDSESLSVLMSPAISSIAEDGVRYICSHCGFLGTELHWKCPSCQCWNVMKPKR